jgi:hypothetical protein
MITKDELWIEVEPETEEIAREIANHPFFPRYVKDKVSIQTFLRKHFEFPREVDLEEDDKLVVLSKQIYESGKQRTN